MSAPKRQPNLATYGRMLALSVIPTVLTTTLVGVVVSKRWAVPFAIFGVVSGLLIFLMSVLFVRLSWRGRSESRPDDK